MGACRYCEGEVKPPRRSYCSNECVHNWKLEHWPAVWTAAVFERDKGVCALCGLDTELLGRWVWHYRTDNYGYGLYSGSSLYKQAIATLKRLGFYEWPRSLWEADHIVPRAEGGNNKLDNLRTLCVPCHKAESRKLAARLAERRRTPSPQVALEL